MPISLFFIFFTLLFLLIPTISTATTTTLRHHHRHLLHQPFFPVTPSIESLSPSPQPQSTKQHPNYPSSSTPNSLKNSFFPTYHSSPPPPPSTALTTFPANISSILLPHQHHSSPSGHSKAIIISVSTILLSATLLAFLLTLLLFKHRRRLSTSNTTTTTTDKSSLPGSETYASRLFPPNTVTSDGSNHHQQPPPHYTSANSSSEFLYLGTLVNSRSGIIDQEISKSSSNGNGNDNVGVKIGVAGCTQYRKLGSPELRPLPPLPRYNVFSQSFQSGEQLIPRNEYEVDDGEDEEFFSPRGSSGRKESPTRVESSSRSEFERIGGGRSRTASHHYSNSCSPSNSITTTVSPVNNASSRSLKSKSKSPDSIKHLPVLKQPIYHSPSSLSSPSSSPGTNSGSPALMKQFSENTTQFIPIKLPPPPPPPPQRKFWEAPVRVKQEPNSAPPVAVRTFATDVAENEKLQRNESLEKEEETPKPRLKPLHWDKVRTSSDRAMVWDQIESNSFQLNEEMIETLFMVNNSNLNPKEESRRHVVSIKNQENRVLDPKKSQNIAILLRALNVTIDEVCEALLEGNPDTLGSEFLESLLKMAPTKEEERKLKDESPLNLGCSAEKFVKAVIDVPFAFKRVEAMLFIVNFDSEVDYLRSSFKTLEAASDELRRSRTFLKLIEAVLKTGNRMNVGTNRGNAHAFKLDTLLMLAHVKATDGKTTLLHFVVQEIIKSEHSHLPDSNVDIQSENTEQSAFKHDMEFRKLGLQVVSRLSEELVNVKKAATLDSTVISSEVVRLAAGIPKIKEAVKLNEEICLKESSRSRSRKFSDSMNTFLGKAEEEITSVEAEEAVVVSKVKETMEFFHGKSGKEEVNLFRIFTVVRDFVSILDRVCREVGKIDERTIYSSVRAMPVNF